MSGDSRPRPRLARGLAGLVAPVVLEHYGCRGIHGQSGRKPTLARPYLPVSPLQEMDQWLWRMEGSAFNPKVIKSVATCELRTVKKYILGSFLDYLAQ